MLPKQWSDISVNNFIEIYSIDKTQGVNYVNAEIISILIDEPVDDLDIDELYDYVNKINWTAKSPHNRYQHKLLHYTIKPLSQLTLFEYIDLDHFFNDNYVTNLDKICAILYKQTKVGEWGDIEMEGYDYDLYTRAEKFLDLPITDVYGIISEYLKFRDKFLDNYRNLFVDADDKLTDDEKVELSPEELKEIEEEGKSAKWSWERTIYTLTNGDITKSEKVGRLPLTYVFNILAMKKELDI
jgi:hypothetical protein